MNAQTWTELRRQIEREQRLWERRGAEKNADTAITQAVASALNNVLVKMERIEGHHIMVACTGRRDSECSFGLNDSECCGWDRDAYDRELELLGGPRESS